MLAQAPALKTDPLPSRVAMTLDDSASVGDMPLSDIAALRLYGDRAMLAATAAAGSRNNMVAALTRYADEITAALPLHRQSTMAFVAVPHAYNCALRIADDLAGWAFTDERLGGCMVGFREVRRVQRDGRPTPKVARRLASPKFIRRYVKNSESAIHLRHANARLFTQVAAVREAPSDDDRMEFLADIEMVERRQEADAEARLISAITPAKPKLRRLRKMAARSAMAAGAVLGGDVTVLRAGKPIVIHGEKFSLRVSCRSVFSIGHGALAVDVLDSQSAMPLASLCTYQPNTPALDQAASLALEMLSGCEDAVLAGANIISTTEAGAGHPALAGKDAPCRAINWRCDRVTGLDERELLAEYWRGCSHEWREATAVFALGSERWRRLSRAFGGASDGLVHVS